MEINYELLNEKEELIVPTVWNILRKEAMEIAMREKLMKPMIEEAILQHKTFKDALSYRLATKLGGHIISAEQWIQIFQEAYSIPQDDFKYDLENAACLDLVAVKDRDPACDKLFTAFMFYKGYKALQIYRVSHVLWRAGRKELASLMQSRSSEVFSVDIHPAAKIGRGLMIDHATGLVIGETAVVGEHCSFLHGVTLGATGKEAGDRHPKIGNHVAIGCNASIIGNIRIGDHAKIGSSSVVVKPVPDHCTAVGTPARIIHPKPLAGDESEALLTTPPLPEELSRTVVRNFPNSIATADEDINQVKTRSHAFCYQDQDANLPINLHSSHVNLQMLRVVDVTKLPKNLLLLIMPLLMIYSLMSASCYV